jgi:WD40 repeat protein
MYPWPRSPHLGWPPTSAMAGIASAGDRAHTVSLWDAETGEELHRFEGNTHDVILAGAFSPGGRFFVAGDMTNRFECGACPGNPALSHSGCPSVPSSFGQEPNMHKRQRK